MKMKLRPQLDLMLALGALGLLVCLPGEAAAGAKAGIGVCGGVIIPGLLPFLILSRLLSAMEVPTRAAEKVAPLFRRLGISPAAAAPLLLGLMGGYPLGAAVLGDMVRSGSLSPREAERLLPCCNNTGPAFLVGAVGGAVFGSVRVGLLLYASHILAALILLLLFGRAPAAQTPPKTALRPQMLAAALPEAIRSAAAAVISISAFVIFFSVLTALLRGIGLLSALSLWLVRCCGAEPRFAAALFTGLLEIGSGIGAMAGLAPKGRNLALASFLMGFGGISVHCQTLSVLADTDVKCARHFVGRILHGGISAGVSFVLFRLLQI